MGVFFYQPNWYRYTEQVILQDLKGKGDSFKNPLCFQVRAWKFPGANLHVQRMPLQETRHEENTNQIQVPLNKINENKDFGTWKKPTRKSEKGKTHLYKPRHTTNFLVSAVSSLGVDTSSFLKPSCFKQQLD